MVGQSSTSHGGRLTDDAVVIDEDSYFHVVSRDPAGTVIAPAHQVTTWPSPGRGDWIVLSLDLHLRLGGRA